MPSQPLESNELQALALRWSPAFAAVAAAALEHGAFHGGDNIIRRIQSSKQSIHNTSEFNAVVFYDVQRQGGVAKLRSLYQGFWESAFYKVLRTPRYPLQAFIYNQLTQQIGPSVNQLMGEENGTLAMQASAGVIIGVVEAVALAPVDSAKIKIMVGDKRSLYTIFTAERFHLMNGVGAACARNGIGSFAQFGVAAFLKKKYFPNDKSFQSHMVPAIGGAIAAVATTNPLDVVKTRAQIHNGSRLSSMSIFKKALAEEGMYSLLTKGLLLRLLQSGPKLAIPMALTSYFTQLLCGYFNDGQQKTEQGSIAPTLSRKS